MAEDGLPGWLRHAVIRGDATASGIALGVVGLIVGVSGVGAPPKLAAVGLIGIGFALVRWSRRSWRALVAEVVARHGAWDPGPSPVAWIADAVWRKHNRFDPELDAMNELISEVDPLIPRFSDPPTGAFHSPVLRPVADNERDLIPPGAGLDPEDPAVPPRGSADALLASLNATPGRQIGLGVRFPVCCGRLATLVSTGPGDRPSSAVFLVEHPGGEAPDPDPLRGMHGFVCRACGRSYATDPAW